MKGSTKTRIALVAAIITIVTFTVDVFTGWPWPYFLTAFAHQVTSLVSTPDFKVESLRTSSGRVLNPVDKFSYKLHIPLDARGTTKLQPSEHIWVVLEDEHGGYYLQSPPVEVNPTGNWVCHNIRPLHGIKKILWVKVDNAGHSQFSRKRDNDEWGKFLELPPNSSEMAYTSLR